MPDVINDFNSRDDQPTLEPPQTTSPLPPSQSEIPPFVPDETPRKNKKKLIIGIVLALAIVLGIGGGVAYALYYNHPDKVLLDTFQNSIKSKTSITDGTYVYKDKKNDGSINMTISTQSDIPKTSGSLDAKIKINYKEFNIDVAGAAMVAESGDFYFKVDNAPKLFDAALETEFGKLYASSPEMAPLVEKIKAFAQKIDGQWIKADKDTISQYSSDYDKQQACTKKAIVKFYEDSKQQQQIVDAYKENRFMVIKGTGKSATINNQDSVAYSLKVNVKDLHAFYKGLGKTDFTKALARCVDSDDNSDDITDEEIKESQKQLDKLKTTVWISRWGHELNKIEFSSDDNEGKLDFGTTVDTRKSPNLKDPSKFLKAKDLTKELEAIYTEALGGAATSGL